MKLDYAFVIFLNLLQKLIRLWYMWLVFTSNNCCVILQAKCVRDMNANSPMEVDGLDYEKIIDAYGTIDADFFKKSSEQHVMLILSQSI